MLNRRVKLYKVGGLYSTLTTPIISSLISSKSNNRCTIGLNNSLIPCLRGHELHSQTEQIAQTVIIQWSFALPPVKWTENVLQIQLFLHNRLPYWSRARSKESAWYLPSMFRVTSGYGKFVPQLSAIALWRRKKNVQNAYICSEFRVTGSQSHSAGKESRHRDSNVCPDRFIRRVVTVRSLD